MEIVITRYRKSPGSIGEGHVSGSGDTEKLPGVEFAM